MIGKRAIIHHVILYELLTIGLLIELTLVVLLLNLIDRQNINFFLTFSMKVVIVMLML